MLLYFGRVAETSCDRIEPPTFLEGLREDAGLYAVVAALWLFSAIVRAHPVRG